MFEVQPESGFFFSYETGPTPPDPSKPKKRVDVAVGVGVIAAIISIILSLWQMVRWCREGRPQGQTLGTFLRLDAARLLNKLRFRRNNYASVRTPAAGESGLELQGPGNPAPLE
jgi:hypothetical protein